MSRMSRSLRAPSPVYEGSAAERRIWRATHAALVNGGGEGRGSGPPLKYYFNGTRGGGSWAIFRTTGANSATTAS